MGIDWFRMRTKHNANQGELERLIESQAEAFQRQPGLWSTNPIKTNAAEDEEIVRGWERQYVTVSNELKQLLDFPVNDHEMGASSDAADLAVCWRVYPITQNSIFPLHWRAQAHRTFLPPFLEDQIAQWKRWLAEAAKGKHQPYLLDLYLYETSLVLNMACTDLRRMATESRQATGRWASKPELVAVREQILSYEVPVIHPVPNFPVVETDVAVNLTDHQPYQAITEKVSELVALTQAWDSKVKQNRKVRYYESYYRTFPQYLDQAQDEGLGELLDWAETCCSREMGLFLDY